MLFSKVISIFQKTRGARAREARSEFRKKKPNFLRTRCHLPFTKENFSLSAAVSEEFFTKNLPNEGHEAEKKKKKI